MSDETGIPIDDPLEETSSLGETSSDEPKVLKDRESTDLDWCPRCGERIPDLIWGQTTCPRCGLHFECC